MLKKKIIAGVGGLLGLAIAATIVLAAPGDQVPPGPIDPVPAECQGIGVAYDGTTIFYTCANDSLTSSLPEIFMTDINGTDLGSFNPVDGAGDLIAVDAIAWDRNEGVLWGGDLDQANNKCLIYSIDTSSFLATLRFSFTDVHGGCTNFNFYDGITVDPVSDTLWLSPDIHTHIHHYDKTGVEFAADVIDFTGLTDAPGECPWAQGFNNAGCWNSGLTMGLDGVLLAGTASDGKIYELSTAGGGSVLGVFATVTGRDEDLECGPLIDGLETVLSRDFDTGRIDILEAPDGRCVITEITLDPPTETNDLTVDKDHSVTATVLANGQPLQGVTVDFEVTSGPNVGETSTVPGGECSSDPNCVTDSNGQTSWSYTNPDGLGVDVIEACYTTANGTKHCAKAKKEWSDLTPPEVSCTETTNPHGAKTPPAGSTTPPGSQGGKNEDGFYLLEARDLLDLDVEIWITDALGSGPFGAFSSGDKVKITESPDATPESKPMGSDSGKAGAIAAHIILNGDALVQAIDDSGNVTEVTCFVPPPPK